MRSKVVFALLSALTILACASVAGDTVNGLPLHVEKLSDNAIRLWVGDYISSTAVSALKTDKGIVVIDSTECPKLDERFRKVIAKKFGRDDFAYLINTHEHLDHTMGNHVYSDCQIIAHEYCAEGIRENHESMQRTIAWLTERTPEMEKELSQGEPGSEEYRKLHEQILVNKMMLESLQAGIEPTYPTKTFADRMTLDLGNMTLELYYMGGTHTASDILVLVPEEGLLFTGDMMADTWLTDTPGCLQAFSMRQGVKRNIPLLLANWKSLIDRKDEITDYIPAHWNGDLSYPGFVDRYNYVKTLYDGIGQAVQDGRKLEDVFSEFSMQAKFPHLVGTPGFTENFVHHGSILALWSDATGAESAGNALPGLIEERGLQAAIETMKAERAKGSDKYYFLEGEFNRLGYGLLNEEKFDEAIAVFKLNVDLFPESWNVYDSLAEGYMKSGQLEKAVSYYNKSLELNPDNENGKKMLNDIAAARAD